MENKTIGYVRVSTNKQTAENQKNGILKYAQSKEMMVKEFIEVEVSGTKSETDRKIDQVINKLGENDILIVSELSRLGRSTSNVLSVINKILDLGVEIHFIKQNLIVSNDSKDTTSKIMITLFALFAELERDLIAQRTKEALEGKENLGHNKKFLKSMYDDYEESIYQYKETNKLSFEKICLLLDPHQKLNFKSQSMRNWWNKRYYVDPNFNIWKKLPSWEKFSE